MAVVVLLLPLVGVRMMTKTSVSGLAVASRWLMPCASHRRKDVHSTVRQILHIRQLSENIDKATNTWINATLQLESAIRKYNSAQTALGNAVDTISGKVDTINTHIDNVLKDAPTKLKVSVRVDDVDWKKIQDMFDKQHEWMTTHAEAYP